MYEAIDSIVFEWEGIDVSLNKFFAGKHWTIRNKIKDQFHVLFGQLLSKKYNMVDKYSVTLEYNSRLDPTNTIILIKIAEDYLRHINILTDDTKKYCKKVTIIPDESMGKKNYKLTVHILSYATKESKSYRA
jgi:predicted nuclease of restriction endonuclease-like RecB superfamily